MMLMMTLKDDDDLGQSIMIDIVAASITFAVDTADSDADGVISYTRATSYADSFSFFSVAFFFPLISLLNFYRTAGRPLQKLD